MRRLFLILAFMFGIILSADDSLSIWLSDGIIVDKNISVNNREFMHSAGAIDEGNETTVLRETFKLSFKDVFTSSSESKSNSTLGAFLSIVRASHYTVAMKNSKIVQHSLPITATISFINILTGELIYAETYTHIGTLETTNDDNNLSNQFIVAYKEIYSDLIEELAKTAKSKFHPRQIHGQIIGITDGLVVLDAGLAGGIAEGDSLKNDGIEIKILYSASNYSVATDLLGTAKIGTSVAKTTNQSLDDLKKPKVALLDIQFNKETILISENMIYQFFSDKLASKASFSLTPVNKNFYEALKALDVGIKFTKRHTPDYFMRMQITDPIVYDLPTNKEYAKVRVYKVGICGMLTDVTGRVLKSDCKIEKIEDNVSFEKTFSREARIEVLVKNGVISLAQEFINDVSFEPFSYKITAIKNGMIEIEDDKNILSIGAPLTVYKNLGTIAKIDNVYIPIIEAEVVSKNGINIIAKTVLKTYNSAPNVSVGDMIFDTVIRSNSNEAKLFSLCKKNSNVGAIKIVGFEEIVPYMIQKRLKYPFYLSTGLQESVNNKITDNEFDKIPMITVPSTAYCLNPVYKISSVSSKDSEQMGYIESVYQAVAGVKEFYGEELKSKYALGGEIIRFVPKDFADSYLRGEFLEKALTNFDESLKNLEIK